MVKFNPLNTFTDWITAFKINEQLTLKNIDDIFI